MERLPAHPTQDPNVGETFKVIPDDLLEKGKLRLAESRYSHFAD